MCYIFTHIGSINKFHPTKGNKHFLRLNILIENILRSCEGTVYYNGCPNKIPFYQNKLLLLKYISFLRNVILKCIKFYLTNTHRTNPSLSVTLSVANRARVALVTSHFFPPPPPTFFLFYALHFLNLWLPVEKPIVAFLNRSFGLRLITVNIAAVARLFVTTVVFTSNPSTFFHRVIVLRSHAKMSFNLTNGENTGLDGSFLRPPIDRSSRAVPLALCNFSERRVWALKLNNSVNGNGVSTAKDSDSSFDVEPVCSHVKRITWIITRGIEEFMSKMNFQIQFLFLFFFLLLESTPLLIFIFIATVGIWCDICHSLITWAEKLILSVKLYKLQITSLLENIFI